MRHALHMPHLHYKYTICWRAQRNEGAVGSALLGRQLAEVGARGPASDRVSDQLNRLLDPALGLHLALHLGGGSVKRLEVKGERHLRAHLVPPKVIGERSGHELQCGSEPIGVLERHHAHGVAAPAQPIDEIGVVLDGAKHGGTHDHRAAHRRDSSDGYVFGLCS
jgi:hypothetical protein